MRGLNLKIEKTNNDWKEKFNSIVWRNLEILEEQKMNFD
jgi:hypothetical protein